MNIVTHKLQKKTTQWIAFGWIYVVCHEQKRIPPMHACRKWTEMTHHTWSRDDIYGYIYMSNCNCNWVASNVDSFKCHSIKAMKNDKEII